MFTHKQAWRRQTRPRRDRNRSSLKQSSTIFNRSTSMPEVSDEVETESEPTYHRLRRNTIDLGVAARKGRTLTFNIRTAVVLIPTRKEYEKHGLASDLWWGREDYSCFKAMARLEVLDILQKHNGNLRSAMAELFQPENEALVPHSGLLADASPHLAVAVPVANVNLAQKHCKIHQDLFCIEPKPIHEAAPLHPLALMAA